MPLYEYRCDVCGHQLEVLQSVKDEPLLQCPQCSNNALRKLVHAPAFTFKGSGWYKDLYSSSNNSGTKSEGSSSAKSGDSSSSSSSTSGSSSSSGSSTSGSDKS